MPGKPNAYVKDYRDGVAPFSLLRIQSLTEQIRWLTQLGSTDVLEVCADHGFARAFLRQFMGIRLTSVGTDPERGLDRVASVLHLPFEHNEFDTVLCCDVLSRFPFADLPRALAELHRVTGKWCIVSLPDLRRQFGLALSLSRAGWHEWTINVERRSYRPLPTDPEHQWAVGHTPQTRGQAVVDAMRAAGFEVYRTRRMAGRGWHTFFILRKPIRTGP